MPNISPGIASSGTTAVTGIWQCFTQSSYQGTPFILNPSSGGKFFPEEQHRCVFCWPWTQSVSMATLFNSARPVAIILYTISSSLVLIESRSTLVGTVFNDTVVSVQIIAGSWRLWTNVNYSGNQKSYSGPQLVFPMPSGFTNTISSVQRTGST
jgi:hypothetical protein